MTIISYTKDILIMKKILAILLMVVGVFIFVEENIFVGFMFFLVGLNLISTEGSEINIENKTYRKIKSVFGLKFGKWKPCPKFEYVSVFKTKESTNVNARGATIATFSTEIILLNIFYPKNKYITFYKTDDKKDAFEVANHFKLTLDIAILDATGSENKWL